MTDTELLQHAKTYIDKLANGINPLTNEQVAKTDVINNVRISKCLSYVSDILKKEIDEKTKQVPKKPFDTEKIEFDYSVYPVSMSVIVKKLNCWRKPDLHREISYKQVTNWLLEADVLELKMFNGKIRTRPTQIGNKIGINTETRTGKSGDYEVVLYNRDAQHFIVDHLEQIMALTENNVTQGTTEFL